MFEEHLEQSQGVSVPSGASVPTQSVDDLEPFLWIGFTTIARREVCVAWCFRDRHGSKQVPRCLIGVPFMCRPDRTTADRQPGE